jgi:predicted Zn finger-like uncharacterized protein
VERGSSIEDLSVIVTCRNCDTSFELDELGVPEEGTQLRCSECKESFYVSLPQEGPGSSDGVDLQADDFGRDLADPGAGELETPDASGLPTEFGTETIEDLETADSEEFLEATLLPEDDFSDLGEGFGDLEPQAETTALSGGDDEPLLEEEAASLEPVREEEYPDSDSAAGQPGEPASAKPVAIGAIELESVPASSLRGRAVSAPGSGETRKRFGALGRGLGWGLVLVLLVLAVMSVFRQASDSMGSVEQTLEVGSFRVESLRGEWVDTMAGQTLLAVTGNLHNPSDSSEVLGALLEVSLVGSDGRRLVWAPAPMGVRISEREIRELTPTALEIAQNRAARGLARMKLPPRGSVPVQAIFRQPPPDAVQFALDLGASVGAGQGD